MFCLFIALIIFSSVHWQGVNSLSSTQEHGPIATNQVKSSQDDSCIVCRMVVGSFYKGLKRMEYSANSDPVNQLTQLQERLCDGVIKLREQCNKLVKQSQPLLHQWLTELKDKAIDLSSFLCVEQLKVCCEFGHFGPDCTPCKGHPLEVCNHHGTCNGNGTRSGTGACECQHGYSGEICSQCSSGFYLEQSASSSPSSSSPSSNKCLPCDSSCLSHCRFKGPKGCEVCKDGYIWDEGYGCLDIDECLELGYNPCSSNSFCVNNEGSFRCFKCDKACNGCEGDGPDMCKECAQGYELKDGICSDMKVGKTDEMISYSRYVTYAGLCIATCIILQNNIYIASLIGFFVALYIAIAEYTIPQSPLKSPIEQAFASHIQGL